MRPGIRIDLYNKKSIMIHEKDFERAQEIIRNFVGNTENAESEQETESSGYSSWDKLRIFIGAVLCGWVMPGKRWEQKKKSKNKKAV
jgi:hypothetical protein